MKVETGSEGVLSGVLSFFIVGVMGLEVSESIDDARSMSTNLNGRLSNWERGALGLVVGVVGADGDAIRGGGVGGEKGGGGGGKAPSRR